MSQPMTTGGQIVEVASWTNRLTLDQYQERRCWLRQLTDPAFNLEALRNVLTPTIFGPEIKPPFDGADLNQDGPGDEKFDVGKLALVPILIYADPQYIKMREAVRRGQTNPDHNWGQRLAFLLRDEGNAGKISMNVWPVGVYVICSKTVWRDRRGGCYAWCVIRRNDCFCCYCDWFGENISHRGHFPSFRK